MINLLYIAGAGRSGSTLFERILGQVNGTAAIGEFRHVWQRDPATVLCECGRSIACCPFWQNVFRQAGIEPDNKNFQAMASAQRNVDRIRYVPLMYSGQKASKNYSKHFEEYTATLRKIYQAIHRESNSQIIIDSSKDISTLFLLTEMPDVTVRILHLVRDGRAVSYAWTKKRMRTDTIGQARELYRMSPQRSALDWMYRNGFTEALRGRTDGYMRLRYDDIVANLYGATMDTVNFMGIKNADLSFIRPDEIRFPKESHALGGNPMRHEAEVVRISMDNAWKTQFPRLGKAVVTVLTWPLLKRYGYI